MAEQEDMELTSLHRHIKKTPICRIVLTRNWQEVTCTKKGIKKEPHGIGQEGKRSNQVGTCASWRGHRGKRLHGRRSTLGNKHYKPPIGLPCPGVQHGKIAPKAGCRAGGTSRRAAGSSSSTCEECTPVLAPEAGSKARVLVLGARR